jgi:hypothetical protein
LRVALGAAYNSHTDPLFAENKSLKLTDLYDYTLAKIGSEVINNIAPSSCTLEKTAIFSHSEK